MGKPCVQHFSATCGASRLATAQALGGLKINAPLPEISHLLFEASSHAVASPGQKGKSRLPYSSTCLTLSDFTVTLPLASISPAPYARNSPPTHWLVSVVEPSGRPKPPPAFWHFSAAARKASHVQLASLGGLPAGESARQA